MLTDTTIAAFKAAFRGELIEPGSPHYDEARKVYNAMIDRRPAPDRSVRRRRRRHRGGELRPR